MSIFSKHPAFALTFRDSNNLIIVHKNVQDFSDEMLFSIWIYGLLGAFNVNQTIET